MTHATKLTRDDTITEALRAANDAIGQEEPTPQAFKIIAALKALRDPQPVRIMSGGRDYLRQVQEAAQREWLGEYGMEDQVTGPFHVASAGITTPLGRLTCTTWRRKWSGKRGERITWASEYTLNDDPISIEEIKKAGLAQRPTTRNRQKKEPTK